MSTGTTAAGTVLHNKIKALEKQVGATGLYKIPAGVFSKPGITIYAKKEWEQIGGSVKARAAYSIIKDAVASGELHENKILLDATSGNTGIAYAAIGRELGIKVTLCLPENASIERKEILQKLGVDIIFTSALEGTDGSQQRALELAVAEPNRYFYADQYKNENNWKAHYFTTALEVIEEIPSITHFVAGLGTTGTFVGTGRRLREINPKIRLVALHPDSALHGMEGWKHLETAIVPTIYDAQVADENLEVSTEQAYEMIKRVSKEDGLLLSPSSAANIVGAIRVAEKVNEGVIVTVLPDNAEKYSEVINKLIKR